MLSNTEDLEQLADTCAATATAIKEYLASNGQPQLTFDQNGPTKFPDDAPPNIQYARLTLREAAQKLVDLATGPEEFLGFYPYQIIMDIAAYRYVVKFQIALSVPFNDSISYEDLAEKCKVDVGQLKQNLRQMMMTRFFHEPVHGRVAHTAASKHLTHPGARSWMEYSSTDTLGTMFHTLDAIKKWGHGSQEPNETGLQLLYNTEKKMFDYYEENDQVRTVFSELMTYVSSSHAMSNAFIGAGFDWAGLGEATIVDVGGNVGHCSVEMAKANPKAKIIVQDLPGIIARAKNPKTCVIPEELLPRFTFMAHNFFETQPVQADVYFLRLIMHDYSDKYCIKVLRPLVKAMKPDSRIIIMDEVLPPVGGAPQPIERFMRAQDIHMGILSNAKERDREQWEYLLRETDTRLRINTITLPPGSAMSLIEVVLAEESTGKVRERATRRAS